MCSYICSIYMLLFRHEKEGNSAIHDSLDIHWRDYAKWGKSNKDEYWSDITGWFRKSLVTQRFLWPPGLHKIKIIGLF